MMLAIFSLLCAMLFVVLDAVDVALTEAAVGAGVSTILLLATLLLTSSRQCQRRRLHLPGLAVAVVTAALLAFALRELPAFGDPQAPIHTHVTVRYIEQSPQEIGIPNMVTSVLASYRGYDTLGEVTVIFCAGIGVLSLLGGRRRRQRSQPDAG